MAVAIRARRTRATDRCRDQERRNVMCEVTRRDAMKLAVGSGLALAMGRATIALAQSDADAQKNVRVGVIGVGDRGTGLLRILAQLPGVDIPAVCDIVPARTKRAQDIVEKALGKRPESYEKGPEDYRRLLERTDIDAVVLGTPQELHAAMTIDSFKAGKFVGSEVPACTTMEECHAMIKAHRETKIGYMMLENYLYSPHVMQVQVMADEGL